MINWDVRWKNKTFWITIIPAIILLVQAVGFELELSELQEKLLVVVNAVFGVLVILGVVVDPTTHGVSDSVRALGYKEPWKDADVQDAKD